MLLARHLSLVLLPLATLLSLGAWSPPAPTAPTRTGGPASAGAPAPDWWHDFIAAREAAAGAARSGGPIRPLPDLGGAPFTIAARVRTTAGGTIYSVAPAQGPWAPQGKSLFIRDGKLCFDVGWVGVVTSATSVADGRWHHVAVTGPRPYALWIDGKADSAAVLDGKPDPLGSVARIGYTCPNFPEPSAFRGTLDDVCIWSRSLTPAEIGADALAPSKAPGSSFAALWRFDGDLSDGSGARHRGVAHGAIAFGEGLSGRALVLDGTAYVALVGVPDPWAAIRARHLAPSELREIGWEQADAIHETDWQPGDYRGLARQYAAAIHAPAPARRAKVAADAAHDLAGVEAVRKRYLEARAAADIPSVLDAFDFVALRRAIRHLAERFGRRYPQAAGYLAYLAQEEPALRGAIAAVRRGDLSRRPIIDNALRRLPALRHEALVTRNPLLAAASVVFVKRKTYQASHYYTDYIDGCRYFGGNLCVMSLQTGRVRELLPAMRGGIFGRFDVSFDARRIVFDYKPALDKGFRLYEVGVDGRGLRQLTVPPPNEVELVHRYRTVGTPSGIPYLTGTDDMHPCYLPDGGIAFVSTRCQKGILCDNPDVLTTTTLYRMQADGSRMRPLSFNTVSEAVPTLTQDGRILYTRWEYVDKGGSACKCIWSMNPDGTHSAEVYANDIADPTTFIGARDIPGRPDEYVVVGAPHMPMGVGSVIRLNTLHSLRTRRPMTNLTPEIETPDESGFRHLREGQWKLDYQGPLFADPYPLSDSFFLVSYNPDQPHNAPAGYGIYLLDSFGNREPVYRDAEYSCWEPYLLRPRRRPAAVPPVARGGDTGTLFLQDVYAGLTGIQRGRVKYLRVMEDCPRPWAARRYWTGDDNAASQQHVAVSKWGHLAPKLTHGIVPVQPDGSAYFRVPADRNIFLQALDADYMELQRMRTFVNVRPGETRGCVGCHEEHRLAPGGGSRCMALAHAPVQPAPQPGERVPRAIDYAADIQPVLDRHCTGCHAGTQPAGGLDLSGELTALFCRSYESLIDRRLAGNVIDEIGPLGGKHANIEAKEPLALGSHTSKLVALLRAGHHDVRLSQAEWVRLVTWVDANAPYYGTWDGRRNLKYRDMPDFRPAPVEGPGCTAWAGGVPATTGSGHPFVCADNGRGRVYLVDRSGRITWEYPAEFPQDVWRLANGNILFSHLHGAKEVRPSDGVVVWEYRAPDGTEVHSCQPLPDGGVMVCECGTRRIVELDRAGHITKQIPVETGTATVHMQFRIARKLANGHYLVALVGEHMVRELDGAGRAVRSIPTPGDVFVALRLPDGNTLIGCGDGHRVIEVDAHDRVVWSLEENELRGHPLRFVAGLQRLPNGNTIVCNWGGHGHVAEQPLVFEVTREKKVVWQVEDYGLFRTISNVQVLDAAGDPSKGELLR